MTNSSEALMAGTMAAAAPAEVRAASSVKSASASARSTPAQTDDELVAAVLGGDEAAFAVLFERYRRLVAKIAYSFFRRREQVEELVQESFAKAYFALGSYRGGHEKSFAAWLSRVTVSTCHDALRQAKRVESTMSDLCETEEEAQILTARLRDEGSSSNIEDVAVSRDLAEKLLSRLEPDDRMALALLEVAGFSVAEVAEVTGWSIPKVKMRAFRARGALRRVLQRFL